MRWRLAFICSSVALSVVVIARAGGGDKPAMNEDAGKAMAAIVSTGHLPDDNPPIGSTVDIELKGVIGQHLTWYGRLTKITTEWLVVDASAGNDTSVVWIPRNRILYVRVKDLLK